MTGQPELPRNLFVRTERELMQRATDTDDPNDRAALITFTALLRRADDARRRLDEEGLIVEDNKGYASAHPALAIETAASREMRGWIDRRPDLFGGIVPTMNPTKPAASGGAPSEPRSLADELAAARAARASNTAG